MPDTLPTPEGAPDARQPSPTEGSPSRHPMMELLTIAAPTVATMTSYTLMQFTDKLIVSRIGPDPIYVGAQGNGGIAAFLPISISAGAITVVNTYVSQNLGAGRPERGPAYAWNGLWLGFLWWLFLIPYGIALPWLMGDLPRMITGVARDPRMVELAVEYGRILIFGSILSMSTRGIAQFFYGMHSPLVVLVAGISANLLNLGLCYVLVFGKFGFPALGIAGSGYATVIATALEFTIPMCVFLGPKLNAKYNTRRAWKPSLAHLRDIFKLGWPGGLMFGNEMVCWTYFMVYLVGQFGPLHSTAGWIAHQWMTLSFMPAVGISVAVTAMVGKCMGMKRPDLAAQRFYMGLSLALTYMGLCGVCFLVFRHSMIDLFIEGDTSPEDRATLVRLGSKMLIATAAFQLFDAVAMTVSGALRGAGDTVWTGIVTILLAWTFIVGGGHYMVAYHADLESLGPWIAAASYIVALCLTFFSRFLTGKWKKIDLLKGAAMAGH